jgi:iodotyrosine deiodinase
MNDQFIPLEFSQKTPDDMKTDSSAYLELMRRRRTVRDFSDRPVDREVIENAIRTAGSAPSGANMQPWHFVAISDEKLKSDIRKAAEAEEREFYERRASDEWLEALAPLGTDSEKPFLEIAPWLIVIFLQKFSYGKDNARLKNYYTSESVGIATGFLISALHNAGLATLTHTPSPMKFLNRLCDRPGDEKPYLVLVTGYPAEDATVPAISKLPLEEISTFVQ